MRAAAERSQVERFAECEETPVGWGALLPRRRGGARSEAHQAPTPVHLRRGLVEFPKSTGPWSQVYRIRSRETRSAFASPSRVTGEHFATQVNDALRLYTMM